MSISHGSISQKRTIDFDPKVLGARDGLYGGNWLSLPKYEIFISRVAAAKLENLDLLPEHLAQALTAR